jgi:hypothetical protein
MFWLLIWKKSTAIYFKFICIIFLHPTVLLALKYSVELNNFAFPLNRYFSQITLTNRIYLYNNPPLQLFLFIFKVLRDYH